jgi:S1-C subfamily serine protease
VQRGTERLNLSLQLVPEKAFFNAELIRRKIGASLQQLTPELADSLGINTTAGLIITEVEKNGPAAEAGLRPRFIVLGIEEQAVQDIASTAKILYHKKKGEKAVLNLAAERSRGIFVRWDSVKATVTVR